MSNKKRIFKKQKALRSLKSDAAMWECIRIGLIAVNNAIELKRERLRASQFCKKEFPSGALITSSGPEKLIDKLGGWHIVPINRELQAANSWNEYFKKQDERLKNSFPKQLEGMMALIKTAEGVTKTVFAGSRDYVAKQNIK